MELQDRRVRVPDDFEEMYIIFALNYEFTFSKRLHQSSACTASFITFA